MSASFDVVVAGAGPGGIAAAASAAEAGMRVCLLDDNRAPGGQIWRNYSTETARKYPHGRAFLRWTERLRSTKCEVWPGWRATDQPASGCLRLESDTEIRHVAFRKLIVATGARERFLPFPGWTLPGVMGAGGLQALVKSGLDPRGKRVVVAGSGPLLLAIAAGLANAGASILGIFEQAPLSRLLSFGLALGPYPEKLIEGAGYRWKVLSTPYRAGWWVEHAEGLRGVEGVTVTNGSRQTTIACDWLACGFHLVPNLELPRLLGCRIAAGYVTVDSMQRSSIADVACIGELTGIGGMEKALLEGQIAGLAAAGREAEAAALVPRLRRQHLFAQKLERAFALRDELKTLSKPDTVVCRCEDVAYSEVKQCGSWREAKLHTRCGMGACQGRICGAATEFLFDWQAAGTRPPAFPATVSAVAAESDFLDSAGK
jgi:NADPH-dependent 2,4-dienoyl-CoA reductase/sulfur reductase-like enzyme